MTLSRSGSWHPIPSFISIDTEGPVQTARNRVLQRAEWWKEVPENTFSSIVNIQDITQTLESWSY